MQYNFHNEKLKSSDVGGVMKEQFREYNDPSKYKNYVNAELSANNFYKEFVDDGYNWFGQIREAKKSTKEFTGRAVRKDAVVLCSTIESVPSSWHDDICKIYFEAKAEWFGHYLHNKGGVDNGSLKSLAVHLDESTPHATYVWTPMKDGKLQAKNILNKSFLRELQRDSQAFTFKWIEEWNLSHPQKSIEPLLPYNLDSNRQHLTESEYKEQQIEKHLSEMKEELERTKLEITHAPNLETYDTVIRENASLKQELSLKEKLIENLRDANLRLQEVAEGWVKQANEWREKFSDLTHKAGERLMHAFGYDVSNGNVPLFPDKSVSAEIKNIHQDAQGLNKKDLRILPDKEIEGAFRVACRSNDGSYETVKSGFESRIAAETWKNELSSRSSNLKDNIEDQMHVHIKR